MAWISDPTGSWMLKDELQACYRSIELALSGEADAIMKGKLDSASFLRTVLDRKRASGRIDW